MEQLDNSLSSLQAAMVLCRPKSVITFCIRYLEDERTVPSARSNADASTKLEELHAIQMLPFLVYQPDEFRNYACVIFCGEQINADATDLGSSIKSKSGSSNNYREFLDGSTIWKIYQSINLPSVGLKLSIIDNYVRHCCDSLKKVDFPLFLSVLRIALACYQIVGWIKDETYSFQKSIASANTMVGFPVSLDASVDTHKLKSYLIRKSGSPTQSGSKSATTISTGPSIAYHCVDSTHQYHLHTIAADDVKTWQKILLTVLEEDRSSQTVIVSALVERLIQRLLPNIPS